MKTCFKCNETKPLDDFYAHPAMKDGHLNKCKECTKQDSKARDKALIKIYEQERSQRPERRALALEYQRTKRRKNPHKDRCRRMVAYHLRVGNITRKPCSNCGAEPAEAHHPDYTQPLLIVWLCFTCHRAWHKANPELP